MKDLKKNKKNNDSNYIPFADKYIYGPNYSDKFDYMRDIGKDERIAEKKKKTRKAFFNILTALFCVALFVGGYFIMCIIMEFNAFHPQTESNNTQITDDAPIIRPDMAIGAKYISSSYLDGGAMISSVIEKAAKENYGAVFFDLKRSDGTLAYNSELTASDSYQSVASPGSDVKKSITMLNDNNITPIARIYCFNDNIAASADRQIAIQDENSSPWKDSSGNAWLNPSSEYAREYLLSIIKEAAGLGIKVIVLDGVAYPADSPAEVRQDILKSFVDEAQKALGNDVKIYVAQNFTLHSDEELVKMYASISDTGLFGEYSLPIITSGVANNEMMLNLNNKYFTNYITIFDSSLPPVKEPVPESQPSTDPSQAEEETQQTSQDTSQE